jgi:hypothetical protein
MKSVLFDEGFKLNNIQCIKCDSSFVFFSFITKNFTMSMVDIENINN